MNTPKIEIVDKPFDPNNRLMPAALFNNRVTPEEGRKAEQPWHRRAAYLIAAGWKTKDVADDCGVVPNTIRDLLKTPWFQDQVTAAQEADGGRDIITMFKRQVVDANEVLVTILHDEKAPFSVRANIATSMIERVYGKATQRVDLTTHARSSDPTKEAQQLAAENERLRKSKLNGEN